MDRKGKQVAGSEPLSGGRKRKGGNDGNASGSERKRQNPAVLQFFEDATVVGYYGESSDESDFNDDMEEEIEGEPDVKSDPGKGGNPPFIFPKEEEMNEEEFDRMMEERYKPGSGFFRYADDDVKSSIEMDFFVPTAKDPPIWKVKCVVGRERHSVFCLMHKFVELRSLGTKLQIISAFSVEHIKGFIFIEAEKECYLLEACKGLSGVYSSRRMVVPKSEAPNLLSFQRKASNVSQSTWARVKSGKYKGDIAQVVAVNDSRRKALIKLIPRIDLQAMAKKYGGGVAIQKGVAPAPRLISSSELEEFRPLIQCRRDRDTGMTFEVLDGLMLKDGYLYKKVSIDSLCSFDVMPSKEEILKFTPAENNESGDLEWLSQLYGEEKKKKTVPIDKGDEKGESSAGSRLASSFDLYTLVCFSRKDFGLIVGMEKDGYYKILKEGSEGPVVVTIGTKDLKNGPLNTKFTALDLHNKTISINDLVKVSKGPSQGKEGLVKQVYRGIIFLYDETDEENGGYFCCKSQMCEKIKASAAFNEKGGGSGPSGFGDFVSSPNSPLSPEKKGQAWESNTNYNRGDKDSIFSIGQALRIRVGPLKGYLCRVIAIWYSEVTVKLDSQHKVLTVKSEHLSEVRGRNFSLLTSEDAGPSSFKPFELLGTEGGSEDWTKGAGVSVEGGEWNARGASAEWSSWTSMPASGVSSQQESNPANLFTSEGSKDVKGTAWDAKETLVDNNSTWVSATANPKAAGNSDLAGSWNSWAKTTATEAGFGNSASDRWGKAPAQAGNSICSSKGEGSFWSKQEEGSSRDKEDGHSSWNKQDGGFDGSKDGDFWGKPDGGSTWGKQDGDSSGEDKNSSWTKHDGGSNWNNKEGSSCWGKRNGGSGESMKDGGSSWGEQDGGSGWGKQVGSDGSQKEGGSWGKQDGSTKWNKQGGGSNANQKGGGSSWGKQDGGPDWGKQAIDSCGSKEEGASNWGKLDGGSSWGKQDGGSSWCKQDGGSSLDKQDGGSSWDKQDGGSSLGKQDGGSSWGKQDGGSSWGKQDGGSSWGKQDGGSSWGKHDGGSSWGKQPDWKDSAGDRLDKQCSWERPQSFDRGSRGSGGRRGGRRGGRDQFGRGRSFGRGQAFENSSPNFSAFDSAKATPWSTQDRDTSWGKRDGGSSWGKQDGDSSWSKQNDGSTWSQQGEGSNWGKQDGSSSWSKRDSSDGSKREGGSSWSKQDGGSGWGKQEGGSSCSKQDGGSFGNKQGGGSSWNKQDGGGSKWGKLDSSGSSWGKPEAGVSSSWGKQEGGSGCSWSKINNGGGGSCWGKQDVGGGSSWGKQDGAGGSSWGKQNVARGSSWGKKDIAGGSGWGKSDDGGSSGWGKQDGGGGSGWGKQDRGGGSGWGKQDGGGSSGWGKQDCGDGSSWGKQDGGGCSSWGKQDGGGGSGWGKREAGGSSSWDRKDGDGPGQDVGGSRWGKKDGGGSSWAKQDGGSSWGNEQNDKKTEDGSRRWNDQGGGWNRPKDTDDWCKPQSFDRVGHGSGGRRGGGFRGGINQFGRGGRLFDRDHSSSGWKENQETSWKNDGGNSSSWKSGQGGGGSWGKTKASSADDGSEKKGWGEDNNNGKPSETFGGEKWSSWVPSTTKNEARDEDGQAKTTKDSNAGGGWNKSNDAGTSDA